MNEVFDISTGLNKTSDSRKYYVYRLVDPRTLQTFYVGKGCGNRVFQHVKDAKSLIGKEDDATSHSCISLPGNVEPEGEERHDVSFLLEAKADAFFIDDNPAEAADVGDDGTLVILFCYLHQRFAKCG